MTTNALYEIYASKCFSLAHTMVIHSELLAKSQNIRLEKSGLRINHNNPRTWKYYLNLAGEYHESDKVTIAAINGDGHPYMRIKIAGDNQPVIVDFTKDLLTGNSGDYSLAAEYSYGSDYYDELVRAYPDCETLILGILNPIDMEIAIGASDGDILYCGGYYRKRLPGMKELYGFERREDVKIDTEFLIEEWEEGLINDLQDYVKDYLRKWIVQDFQEYHTHYYLAMQAGLIGGLITNIHRFRIANCFSYSTHSFYLREFINSFGYLGEHVDVLTRAQQQYLYRNMKWLTTNKGKEKVLQALIDNLLTPSGIPLTAYNLGHDNWDMQASGSVVPTIEFKKEYLNLDPATVDIGTPTLEVLKREEFEARDNGLWLDEQVRDIEADATVSRFNSLKTKILESDFTEMDRGVFFNLEEFQFYQWVFAVYRGTYRGSIFITHPVTGGRLQLTPLTALNLYYYAVARGYFNVEIENSPPMVIRNIPKSRSIPVADHELYPTWDTIREHSLSPFVTDEVIAQMFNFPQPDHNFTSTTDFYTKTTQMFDAMESRRGIAANEEDIFANGELELIAAKFYHMTVEVPPISNIPYNTWLNNIGIDVNKLNNQSFKVLADSLLQASLGLSDKIEKSSERMHQSIIHILKFFLSYTVQLVSKFTKTSSRVYGLKTLRLSLVRLDRMGISNWDIGMLTFVQRLGIKEHHWWYYLNALTLEHSETHKVDIRTYPLIDLLSQRYKEKKKTKLWDVVGLTVMLPDEDNPDQIYTELAARRMSVSVPTIITDVLDDVMDITGQSMELTIIPDEVMFLDTLGLTEITQDDFNFTITLERE